MVTTSHFVTLLFEQFLLQDPMSTSGPTYELSDAKLDSQIRYYSSCGYATPIIFRVRYLRTINSRDTLNRPNIKSTHYTDYNLYNIQVVVARKDL